MKARYDRAEVNVNKISEGLEKHQIQLLRDIACSTSSMTRT